MDEKLKLTIGKIVQLSKQNPEFDAELRKRLDITSSAKSVYDEERIVRIEKYLGLDFMLIRRHQMLIILLLNFQM